MPHKLSQTSNEAHSPCRLFDSMQGPAASPANNCMTFLVGGQEHERALGGKAVMQALGSTAIRF